ncbi:sugar efflux transporter for intercellular exchange-domain-containing protein [Globomyces pollinis-pini]|nr:sugar efflux transporter for intercellular exchange-domain-containing protein [Globomyces pollinis-pini]
MLEPVTVLFTFGLFLTYFIDAQKYRLQRSTGNANILPLLATITNTTLWLKYALLVKNSNLLFINTAGLIIATLCLINFHSLSPFKAKVENQIIYMLFINCTILTWVNYFYNENTISILGSINAIVGILTSAAPLSTAAQIIKTKSSNGLLSLPLTVMSLIVCFLWTAVGISLNDHYITIPNLAGSILAIFQFALYFLYSQSTSHSKA